MAEARQKIVMRRAGEERQKEMSKELKENERRAQRGDGRRQR